VGYGQPTFRLPKSLHLQVCPLPRVPASPLGTKFDAQQDQAGEHQQQPVSGVERKQCFEGPSKRQNGKHLGQQDHLFELVPECPEHLGSGAVQSKVFEHYPTQRPNSLSTVNTVLYQEIVQNLQVSEPCVMLEAMKIA